ncbi:MAG: hypothetical protein AAF334_03310 [Pseudomonadota bacterium]
MGDPITASWMLMARAMGGRIAGDPPPAMQGWRSSGAADAGDGSYLCATHECVVEHHGTATDAPGSRRWRVVTKRSARGERADRWDRDPALGRTEMSEVTRTEFHVESRAESRTESRVESRTESRATGYARIVFRDACRDARFGIDIPTYRAPNRPALPGARLRKRTEAAPVGHFD